MAAPDFLPAEASHPQPCECWECHLRRHLYETPLHAFPSERAVLVLVDKLRGDVATLDAARRRLEQGNRELLAERDVAVSYGNGQRAEVKARGAAVLRLQAEVDALRARLEGTEVTNRAGLLLEVCHALGFSDDLASHGEEEVLRQVRLTAESNSRGLDQIASLERRVKALRSDLSHLRGLGSYIRIRGEEIERVVEDSEHV